MAPANPLLLVIAGPTASGKTALSLEIADHYKTEILSADSRQCYRELTIGTAKPSVEQLVKIRHHFINSHSITEHFSAGQFAEQSSSLLSELFSSHTVVVAVGGTGLYLKALTEGFDEIPQTNTAIRSQVQQLYEKNGLSAIQSIVKLSDPLFYSRTDIYNTARMIRATEVILSTGKPFSDFLKNERKKSPFTISPVVIEWPRAELYHRINLRVDQMMEAGLLKEAEALYAFRHHNALKTVGYTELFDYFEGKFSLHEAIEKIKQHSRNYAKRQLTWFRNQGDYKFLNLSEAARLLRSHGLNP